MNFPTNVYLVASVTAFLISFATLPIWRNICLRTGHVDDPGHRKIHADPIPLAGGLSVLTGIIVPILAATIFLLASSPGSNTTEGLLGHGLDRRAGELTAILLGAVGMVALGWIDDKIELRPLVKFGGQFAIALLVALANIRITLFVHNTLFSYAITILWILTVINAFNFMDNMNGLCTGLGVIGAGYFAVMAAMGGQYLVTILALLTVGALVGFLPYNFPKATAFLGDAGSHLVGYLLAIMAILPHFYTPKQPNPWAVLVPLLVLSVPLADLVCVVIIRWRLGKPFFLGDNNHLSHRLVRRGLTSKRTVLLIWLIAALIGGMAPMLAFISR